MRLGVHLVVDSGSQAEHVANSNRQEQKSQDWHLHAQWRCVIERTVDSNPTKHSTVTASSRFAEALSRFFDTKSIFSIEVILAALVCID